MYLGENNIFWRWVRVRNRLEPTDVYKGMKMEKKKCTDKQGRKK